MATTNSPVPMGEVTPSGLGFKLPVRAKRVMAHLAESGPVMANDLPTDVARKFVGFVTDRIEQDYDNAVSLLLFEGLARSFSGDNGYTYIELEPANPVAR